MLSIAKQNHKYCLFSIYIALLRDHSARLCTLEIWSVQDTSMCNTPARLQMSFGLVIIAFSCLSVKAFSRYDDLEIAVDLVPRKMCFL